MSGTLHKIISILFRLTELASAIIVLAILGRFCYYLSDADVHADSRIVYTMVVAGIGIVYSIFFCLPFSSLFLAFPFDFILWIMWLVAFCLLETKTASGTCSSRWYYDYWGYYWGRFWRVGPIGRVNIRTTGCTEWRVVLSFSFIASFVHLFSGFLGIYVCRTYVRVKDTVRDFKHQTEKLTKPQPKVSGVQETRNVENGADTQPGNA